MKRYIASTWKATMFLAATILIFAPRGNAVERILPLPAEFAAYRTWKPLIKQPYEVPYELWIQCAAPTEVQWEQARKTHGPHTRRLIQVYASRDAERALKNTKNKTFPVGSIIAKEKLLDAGSQPEFAGVAFMIKRSADQYPETGGWEFVYYPSSDSERKDMQLSCAGCHKTAARDYVFADYLSKKP